LVEFVPRWSRGKKVKSPTRWMPAKRESPNIEDAAKSKDDPELNNYQPERLDSQAKAAGLMIGIPGVLYTLTLSKSSDVYIEQVNGKWEAWRETYQPGKRRAVSDKTIVKGQTLDYVWIKVIGYFDYIEKKWRG
jgi:hypothetical protein